LPAYIIKGAFLSETESIEEKLLLNASITALAPR